VVRDPPRKSEQATRWAVQCNRDRRAQRRRPREPTTCTERRLRNGRRWYRLRIHGPQRERQRRVLGGRVESRSRGRKRQSRSASEWRINHCKGREWRHELERSEGSEDCMKGLSVATIRRTTFGVRRSKIWAHDYSAGPSEDLDCEGVRIGWVGQGTCGQRYLLLSSNLDYCIRLFSFGSHELTTFVMPIPILSTTHLLCSQFRVLCDIHRGDLVVLRTIVG
jgi:hypothetical protein